MAAEKGAVTRRAAGPSPQHPRARGEHPGCVAEHEAQGMRDLGRQKGARIALQDLIEDDGGARSAPRPPRRGPAEHALIRRSARVHSPPRALEDDLMKWLLTALTVVGISLAPAGAPADEAD